MTLTLPEWFDFHTHFHQGPAMASYVQAHLDMGCASALAMPNTQPSVSRVSGATHAARMALSSVVTLVPRKLRRESGVGVTGMWS